MYRLIKPTTLIHLLCYNLVSNLMGSLMFQYGRLKKTSLFNVEHSNQPYGILALVNFRIEKVEVKSWENGFGLLLISKWDLELGVYLLRQQLQTINMFGWIPAVHVLTAETESLIPSH